MSDIMGANYFTENRGIHDPKLFKGDMILTPKQRYRAEHGMDIDSDRKRASIRTGRLWPGGVVVYAVQSALCKFIQSDGKTFKNQLTNK